MAREFRKHAVSLVTITQNPEQFIEDPRGSVIAQNAYTKVLKRLDTIGAKAARTAFGLSLTEEQRLTTLDQKKALLMVGATRLLVEITASQEEYRLAHTDPPTGLEPLPPERENQQAKEPARLVEGEAAPGRSARTRKKRSVTATITTTLKGSSDDIHRSDAHAS
jgi:hypothetical protein